MIESATIALLGGVSGTLVAWWAFQALMPSLLSSLPGIPAPRLDVSPNVTVLWFGLAVTALTAVASGLVPALRASNQELRTAMKQDAGPSKDRSGRWLRGALLGVQAAVCMVLLVSAGLLLRGLHAAYTVDPGFEYQRVAVVSIPLRGPQYSDGGAEAFTKQLGERIGGLPGVLGVAQTSKVPLSRGHHQTAFRLPQEQQTYDADMNSVSPEFFSLLGVPIVSGRTFTRAELSAPIRAVIVTQATARRFWPGQNPVGRTIVMDRETVEVVGIAKDAQVSRIGSTESSFLYLPALASSPRLNLLVKTDLPFAALGPSLRRTIESLDGALVPEIRPLESNVEFWRAGSRALAVLSACLSALGVSLAALGVYGVVSYLVARRRREVGIRVTLGASPLALQALLLRETLRPVSVGLFAGLAGAAAVSRVLESTLFGVSPLDPIAFVGAALFLLIVAATATLVPTRQVLRIDPMTALRHD
jgi:predicted permease